MIIKVLIPLILLTLSQAVLASGKVELVTFNTGFAKAKIFNLVACTRRRTRILEKVLDQRLANSNIANDKTIYLFQELYTRASFKALKRLGKKYGYKLYPDVFKRAKKSGIVTFTNFKVKSSKWIPFKRRKYPGIRRGVQVISIEDNSGNIIDIMNTHTAFSGALEPDSAHLSQLNQIKNEIVTRQKNNRSIVLGGDFNIGENYSTNGQRYDLVETIWKPFVEKLNAENIFKLNMSEPTWDQENNFLVNKPSTFVRLFVTRRWGSRTSTIDHIFSSRNISFETPHIIFNKPIDSKTQCRKRNSYLSDHYGIVTTLNLNHFSTFEALAK